MYTKKLDDRSKCVVYFGREPDTKAHRVFDPVERRIHVSRDVVFAESKSWTWNETTGYTDIAAEKAHAELTIEEAHDQQTNEVDTRESVISTQSPDSPHASEAVSEKSGESSTPRRFRSMGDIYENKEEIELEEELLLLGIEEPVSYQQAVKENPWRDAMKIEIEAIERNNT